MLHKLIFLTIFVVYSLVRTSEAAAGSDAAKQKRPANDKECKDEDSGGTFCPGFAAGGACHDMPLFMWVMCRASCGWCEDCDDSYSNCTTLADEGKCKHSWYKEYMISYCRCSCQQCWYGAAPPPDQYKCKRAGTSP